MRTFWPFSSVVLLVALLALLAFALCGCAAPTNSVIVQCIPLKTWSASDQDRLRKEYDALVPEAKMRVAFKDYMGMRDADRACFSVTH